MGKVTTSTRIANPKRRACGPSPASCLTAELVQVIANGPRVQLFARLGQLFDKAKVVNDCPISGELA